MSVKFNAIPNLALVALTVIIVTNTPALLKNANQYIKKQPRIFGAACIFVNTNSLTNLLCGKYAQIDFTTSKQTSTLTFSTPPTNTTAYDISKNKVVSKFITNKTSTQTKSKKALLKAESEEILPKLENNILAIPSLKIQTPLVYPNDTTEDAFQKALENGVSHYPGTAQIGQNGNSYFFGHSSDFAWSKGKFKKIFAPLPQIKPGAIIYTTTPNGLFYTYKVYSTAIIAATDSKVLSQETHGKKLLTLQTSYPVGTAQKRFIAQAELVE